MISLRSDHGSVDPGAYDDLRLAERAPANRPYVGVNMVMSADGRARIGGDTSQLGNAADLALFLALRNQVDCVVAGTRTISAERYKGPASGEQSIARREAAGLRPRPLFATITRSGVVDRSIPLLADAGIEVLVFSEAEGLDFSQAQAKVTVEPVVDPTEVLRVLRDRYAVGAVLLEGGPTLNGPFFAAGLVDELFLTLAPKLVGSGEELPIVAAPLAEPTQLRLISALSGDDHLFLRYGVG